jgi:hypothetical protein
MRKFLFLILIGIISCEQQGEIAPDSCQPSNAILGNCNLDITITDQELFDTVYSAFKFHDEFYTEELNDYSIYYINTISVSQQSPWRWLCTDNIDTATAWVERSNLNSSVYRVLKETLETDKYFEFLRNNPNFPTDKVSFRVYKCSYIEFCYYQENDDSYETPTLLISDNNVTQSDLVEFVEFLNFSSSYNFGGRKFLETLSCETSDSIYVSLLGTSVVYGDWGLKDQITLTMDNYGTHKNGGKILSEHLELKTIDGKQN